MRLALLPLLATMLLLPGANLAVSTTEVSEPARKSVHLFNLASQAEEAELLAILDDFNELLGELGHSDLRYRLWKAQGEPNGAYAYLFDSTWPDQATYDVIHKHERFTALVEKHRAASEKLLGEQVYNRYVEVTSRSEAPPTGDARGIIKSMHEEANVALSQGDLDKVMTIYADDVMSMPPNQTPLVGKPAVRAMWESFLSTYAIEASVSVEEVEVAGDLAYDRGTYRMKLTPKAGGPPIEDEGKYLDIVRLQPDGSWKYARVSWSSSRPQ